MQRFAEEARFCIFPKTGSLFPSNPHLNETCGATREAEAESPGGHMRHSPVDVDTMLLIYVVSQVTVPEPKKTFMMTSYLVVFCVHNAAEWLLSIDE